MAPLAYAAPRSLAEATGLKREHGSQALVIAGGTWAIPNLAATKDVALALDLRHLSLTDILFEGGRLRIGACVTYDTLGASEALRRSAPLLSLMAAEITGGPQIRGRGTLGGSACYANPASDAPACLVALEASFELVSDSGSRRVAARDFFVGPFRTALRPDELLVSIDIPVPIEPSLCGYHKLKICEGSWPIATAACLIGPKNDDGIRRLTFGIGAVSSVPVCSTLEWKSNSNHVSALKVVSEEAAAALPDEWSDELAGPGYRKAVAPVVIERALRQALEGER